MVRAEGDYYDLLGVPRNADSKTIKQAYRQKARKYHPVSRGFITSPPHAAIALRARELAMTGISSAIDAWAAPGNECAPPAQASAAHPSALHAPVCRRM